MLQKRKSLVASPMGRINGHSLWPPPGAAAKAVSPPCLTNQNPPQLPRRHAQHRVAPFWRDIAQGAQHEGARMHPRVGQDQVRAVQHLAVKIQQIQIHAAWRVGCGAHPPERFLQLLKNRQQTLRIKGCGVHTRHSICEGWIVRIGPSRRSPKPRSSEDWRALFGQRLQRRLQKFSALKGAEREI